MVPVVPVVPVVMVAMGDGGWWVKKLKVSFWCCVFGVENPQSLSDGTGFFWDDGGNL